MPVQTSFRQKCPECEGWGAVPTPGKFGKKCPCCNGDGLVTAADLQAFERKLDAEAEAGRRDLDQVRAELPTDPEAHPMSGRRGEY